MSNNKKSNIVKNALVLCAITLASGLLLGMTNELTQDRIVEAMLQKKVAAYKIAYPNAQNFQADDALNTAMEGCQAELDAEGGFGSTTINEAMYAVDASGAPVGYIFSITSGDGYNGDVVIALGMTLDGETTGVSIMQTGETPGLGLEAGKIDFLSQYHGKAVDQFEVTKSGSQSEQEIDALTGATITSRAVTNAVNTGLFFVHSYGGGR
jgi:electron transport complex protein RnfG